MADIIKADCESGRITHNGTVIAGYIAGAGRARSSGIAIMEKDKAVYIPLDAFNDLVSIIENTASALNAIASGINNVYIATQGGAPGPGAAQIQSACQQAEQALNSLRNNLR